MQKIFQTYSPLYRNAFNLVEVVITLGIISLVAAFLIKSVFFFQDVQYQTAYKTAFSDVSQALLRAKQQDVLFNVSGEGDTNHALNFLALMNQFVATKKCINNDNDQCWASGEKYKGMAPYSTSYAFIDNSGRAWSVYYWGKCWILVDTNGFKQPNRWGKDRFLFFVSTDQSPWGEVGTPIKIAPASDNWVDLCFGSYVCATKKDYYGTSWLFGK